MQKLAIAFHKGAIYLG